MDDPLLDSHLRQRRTAAGLSQAELAGRVGASRQALGAIEAGRQVPSTALSLLLARALRCGVEELFSLASEPAVQASLSVAAPPSSPRVIVGQVDGRWVAHPRREGDRPGDGVLVGAGADGDAVTVRPGRSLAELQRQVLVAGCAPLLGVLTGCLERTRDGARASWIAADSTRALSLLQQGLVHVAGLHLAQAAGGDAHLELVRERFGGQAMTIVNLAGWRQGFVVPAGNPLGLHAIDDLRRPGVRVGRRASGAGAQQLLLRLLAERGLDPEIASRGPLAAGHTELARWVRLGFVDVGIAIEAVALAEGLDFVPLSEERFDLIVPDTRLQLDAVSQLLELLGKPVFRSDAGGLAGYDLSSAGHASSVAA